MTATYDTPLQIVDLPKGLLAFVMFSHDNVEDDGLETPRIGEWGLEKYRLVECYARIFATSMKNKWAERVYIDLFAGAGRARVRETRRVVNATPLRAVALPDPFDRYVFSERNPRKLSTLQDRIKLVRPNLHADFLCGDSNDLVDNILAKVPSGSGSHRVLSFCFADPFSLTNLRFETIRRIARRYVDFLILIPTGMDPGRNEERYLKPDSSVVSDFLGRDDWREAWRKETKIRFGDFVAREFGFSMKMLDYRFDGLPDTHEMRSTRKNLSLYRLGMFSRSGLGSRFWDECRKYSAPQLKLFERKS